MLSIGNSGDLNSQVAALTGAQFLLLAVAGCFIFQPTSSSCRKEKSAHQPEEAPKTATRNSDEAAEK